MRDGMRRVRRQETEETIAGAVAQVIGYALLTGAVVLVLMGLQ